MEGTKNPHVQTRFIQCGRQGPDYVAQSTCPRQWGNFGTDEKYLHPRIRTLRGMGLSHGGEVDHGNIIRPVRKKETGLARGESSEYFSLSNQFGNQRHP